MDTYNGIICTGAALFHAGYGEHESPDWAAELALCAANAGAVIVSVDMDSAGFYARPFCDGCGELHLGQDMFSALLEEVA